MHLYFHQDFDGICSAAALELYLRALSPRAQFLRKPVDYDLKRDWPTATLEKHTAVVDFLYHPDAEWWFDHHETTFVREDWQLGYRPDEQHVWRPDYKSCPRIIIESVSDLSLKGKLRLQFAEYLEWCDLIDSAGYESARQAVECAEPALRINATLQRDPTPDYLGLLIDSFQALPLARVAELHQVVERFSTASALQAKAISYIRRTAVIDRRVVFLDFARHAELFNRYAVYHLFPTVAFQIALYKSGPAHRLTVAANPWSNFEGPDLGAVCEKYGGGGHRAAAGILFRSRRRALRVAKEIAAMLRGESRFYQQLRLNHAASSR